MIKNDSQLTLENVSFSWPSGVNALDQCNFSISKKGLWMIVGSNGSGKSTLFRLISGMITPQTGKLVCTFKPALIFQNPEHQILLPSCGSDLMLSAPRNLKRKELHARIKSALAQVGLAGMFTRPIHTLSGGQKQRLAIAGAIVSEANLLLLDEPTALLDPENQLSILTIVQDLIQQSKHQMAALWITHRLEELAYCDGGVLMKRGEISKWYRGDELMKKLK